ncbi:MAG TPA: hypothetical protein PKD61_13885, partial [Polyangiaceae bacterium]|nr:hypothetical protein [Polyangiaceae bacterium]
CGGGDDPAQQGSGGAGGAAAASSGGASGAAAASATGGSSSGGAAGTGGSSGSGATAGSGGSAGSAGSGGTGTGGSAGNPSSAYEGFGAITQGHASCPQSPSTVHVTTLADSGAGSLRAALSAGCRLVVFDVGGTITLKSDLNLPYSYVTVDGATAPSPGITIQQPGTIGTTIEARNSIGPAHDIILRYLRMDGLAQSHQNAGDIWGLDGESAAVSRVIIDHLTGVAATDGVFDVWEDVKDVTLSWNLILDTVTALHLSTSDTKVTRERFSIHHNVFARNNERQIRIRHNNQLIDYVNNVVYGWGWMEGGGLGLDIHYDAGETNPSLNVMGNVFHHVAGLKGTPNGAISFGRGASEGSVYFEDNLLPSGESDAVSSGAKLSIPASAAVTRHPASSLGSKVVPHVGTHYPTPEEAALLATIAKAITAP